MRQLENTLKIKDSSFIYTPEGMYFSERLAYNKEAMLSHLQQVADMAIDEKDRRAVNRLMQQMIGQE